MNDHRARTPWLPAWSGMPVLALAGAFSHPLRFAAGIGVIALGAWWVLRASRRERPRCA